MTSQCMRCLPSSPYTPLVHTQALTGPQQSLNLADIEGAPSLYIQLFTSGFMSRWMMPCTHAHRPAPSFQHPTLNGMIRVPACGGTGT